MESDLNIYLQSTYFIDADHEQIRNLGRQLTMNCQTDSERAQALFYFVRDKIHYNMYDFSVRTQNYMASNIISIGHGWCAQKAIALVALGRACRIPSRLIVATIRNHKIAPEAKAVMGTDIFFPHIFNQFYLGGKWIKCAATFDLDICERLEVPAVEFNGNEDAILSNQDLAGGDYIEYLQDFGHFADLPWDWIWQQYPQVYRGLDVDAMIKLLDMDKQ